MLERQCSQRRAAEQGSVHGAGVRGAERSLAPVGHEQVLRNPPPVTPAGPLRLRVLVSQEGEWCCSLDVGCTKVREEMEQLCTW